jgi:hypothetical protein
LEQVHVRGIVCRGLRLELVAGLGLALAIPALAVAAEKTQGMATQTSLAAETRTQNGSTEAAVSIHVLGADGVPAAGAVTLEDQGKPLAGVALDEQGQAKTTLTLPAGAHSLTALYAGDATHRTSQSRSADVQAQATTTATPDFAVSVAPATLTLAVGASGQITTTITPLNAAALTSPMFVTVSCSGLPDQASCTAFPATVEIQSTTAAPLTSTVTFVTQKASTASLHQGPMAASHSIAWALLFPGALGLAGMAWGTRRRRWLSRFSLIALAALVTMLGTTGCNPRYYYLNHGPEQNPATPTGTYTVTIAAQSSNGVTATTHTTTMALTVQ